MRKSPAELLFVVYLIIIGAALGIAAGIPIH